MNVYQAKKQIGKTDNQILRKQKAAVRFWTATFILLFGITRDEIGA